MRDAVIVVPLGSVSHADAERAVRGRLDSSSIEWLDRARLRQRPLLEVPRLLIHRYDRAVLVAQDLEQPRLTVTSLMLGLIRAGERWRLDLTGRTERFFVSAHLARSWGPLLRHGLAIAMAMLLAYPLLRLLLALISTAPPRRRTQARRLLYLRSQLWFGLQGGGSVAHTAGVIGGLQSSGVRVDVVSSDKLTGVAAPTEVVRPVVWFDGLLRDLEEVVYNVPFTLAGLRSAASRKPQAIYQRHTAYCVAGALLARVLRVPLVLEFNSSEVWKGRYWGGLHLPRLAELVERINLRAADLIVVVSDVLRLELLAQGVPAERVLVNPNGVDPTHFSPTDGGSVLRTRLGLTSSVVTAFSGTFGVWHGIPALAQAIPRVLAARPHARFLLLGDGPLRRLVEPLAASSGVILTGLIPHTEVPSYLAAADILVSPHGRQADGGEFFGSPTKLFEYMAAGRPIVASFVGQIAQVLEHEATALLAPPDDPAALAAALIRLIDDGCLRARLGRNARDRAVACHTWQQNAERLLASLHSG
ncbi:MAG TPA: glycosyltransferase family 4 protein [Chloroflexota bacterium]|nr:glycosyltransferase family 4 protein [Chloroflexota bacterium]